MPSAGVGGCPTDAEIARFVAQTPGAGAPDVALHISACPRCQRRVLSLDRNSPGTPERRSPPSPLRLVALACGLLLLLLLLLLWAQVLLD